MELIDVSLCKLYKGLCEKYKDKIDEYFEDDAKKLHKMVDSVIKNLNFYDVDIDEYYSLSYEIFFYSLKDYDETQSFYKFIYSCLYKKFCTYMTMTNRDKRKNKVKVEKKDTNGNIVIEKIEVSDISFDATLDNDDGIELKEKIASDINIENELSDFSLYGYSEEVELFLGNLSENPRRIAEMIMDGYSVDDIKEKLGLTDKQYHDCWKTICSYENKRVLYKKNNSMEDDEMSATVLTEDVAESYKNTSYSIDSISKQLQKKRIRDDHILQRHSGQWKSFAKSELISDILRGKSLTQIIISEEIKKGLRMQWLIDGKQRCTTLDDYLHDGFAISKNVKNYNIRYQTTKVDDNGNELLNEDGFTEMEFKEFDIRGKKFSQLPEELQEIFKDRQIPVLYNMNCTKKDIADDIARFNRSRPMNKAQNGWLGLEESFAEFVENIAKMQFFQSDFAGSTYTNNNNTSGMIRRIIVEGIMASDFIDDFSKDFEKMCEFLSDEASDSNFTEFYSFIERLTSICNKDVAKMFNAKDSFLWFGLFSRFTRYGVDDNNFIDFMIEFDNSLHSKKVGDNSFDDLCIDKKTGNSRSTKDKYIVVQKMELLETLMKEYLHIESIDQISPLDFIKENVDCDITEDDISDYKQFYEDDLKIEVDNSSKLLDEKNINSMLALIAYVMNSNIKINVFKEWLVTFFNENNTYNADQKSNYLFMRDSLQKMAVAG